LKKRSSKFRSDPHGDREASRYEQPIASRELILQVLGEAQAPLTERDLSRRLGLKKRDESALGRRLAAMEREGQILRNRKGAILIARKLDLTAGRVEGHPDGYGFVAPDPGGESMYLNHREMRKVLHGDRVMVRQAGLDRRGRPEATIVEVVERGQHRVVGRFHREHDILFVACADRRISQDVLIAPKDAQQARSGEVVVAEIVSQPDGHAPPVGRIVEILGNATDPGMEIEIALRKHRLPFEFSDTAKARAMRYPAEVRAGDREGRVDLRDLPLVTIDGESAKDFDDAVYCEELTSGSRSRKARGDASGAVPRSPRHTVRRVLAYRLIVAIADVGHYVRHGDPLDLDARERGNSVYFPRRVIPMLPERLSNGLCSLNAQVDRLCMACDMTIERDGEIGEYRFYPAVMRSRARLTYTEVARVLGDPRGEDALRLAELAPRLRVLHDLYRVLAHARWRRGAIDFETIETAFVFDDRGQLGRIERMERNDAHRLIEECMLAANVCASDFLRLHEHPALFRVHEGPTPEKLAQLRDFLKVFGLDLGGGDDPKAMDYARLLESITRRPDAAMLQTVLLRSLKQAMYSPRNVGHFGLAYEAYTHFTSPIRRYPDLLIHRAIRAVLAGSRYDPGNWEELGKHCSQTERRADEATRDVEAYLKCFYMRDRVGDVFEGSITAVTNFGVFVALDDYYVEGLVHVSELGSDYFRFDAGRHELLGERMRKRFRLADRVRVKIVRVDLETSRMDFVLA